MASNAATSATPPADWTYNISASSSSYLILGYASNYVVSEAFSTVGFTNLTVDFLARSYGTVSGTTRTNITVSISSDNGSTWTAIGVVAPANNVMNAMPTLTDTANLGNSQTRIRWQALGASANSGVGIQALVVKGWSAGGGPAYVPGYSNLTVAGTSQAVTGLTTGATYYFRARAVNASGTGANSPVASVTTVSNAPAGTPPTVDAIAAQVATAGVDFEITVTATATDGDPILSFACTSAVDVATWDFDGNTGDFLFSPTAAQLGTNIFSFTATDKDGTSAPVEMSVKVYTAAATNDFTMWVEDQDEDPVDPNFDEGADYDGDGKTTYEEYLADTDPASSNSVYDLTGNYSTAAVEGGGTGAIRFASLESGSVLPVGVLHGSFRVHRREQHRLGRFRHDDVHEPQFGRLVRNRPGPDHGPLIPFGFLAANAYFRSRPSRHATTVACRFLHRMDLWFGGRPDDPQGEAHGPNLRKVRMEMGVGARNDPSEMAGNRPYAVVSTGAERYSVSGQPEVAEAKNRMKTAPWILSGGAVGVFRVGGDGGIRGRQGLRGGGGMRPFPCR